MARSRYDHRWLVANGAEVVGRA